MSTPILLIKICAGLPYTLSWFMRFDYIIQSILVIHIISLNARIRGDDLTLLKQTISYKSYFRMRGITCEICTPIISSDDSERNYTFTANVNVCMCWGRLDERHDHQAGKNLK